MTTQRLELFFRGLLRRPKALMLTGAALIALTIGGIAYAQTFTTIDVPGSTATFAVGINDAGQIVGVFNDATTDYGFLKDGATFTTIDVPASGSTYAIHNNDVGHVVGVYFPDSGGFSRGFLKEVATFTIFEFPGSFSTNAWDINDGGQIVGTYADATSAAHGFLKDGATFITIDVPGSQWTEAHGINDAGQIVGTYADATYAVHGFLKDGATFTTIDVPGAIETHPYGVNDAGQIVGFYYDATSVPHGFVTPVVPAQAVQNLIIAIESMGLQSGVTTSLTATLKNFDANNVYSACGKLRAFINKVNTDARSGRLSSTQASQLLQAVPILRRYGWEAGIRTPIPRSRGGLDRVDGLGLSRICS